jgi:hypothetical protein
LVADYRALIENQAARSRFTPAPLSNHPAPVAIQRALLVSLLPLVRFHVALIVKQAALISKTSH